MLTATDEERQESHKKKMVSLSDIIASNDRILSALLASLVAVFADVISAAGKYTLNAFSKYAPAPKIQEKMAVVNVSVK